MTGFLLAGHVLAAILAIGPIAIAASMFAPAVRAAHRDPEDPRKAAVLAVLHRITRVYAVIGIFVPVFGLATGARLGVLADTWLIVSMILTAIAAVVLILAILPAQQRALVTTSKGADGESAPQPDRLGRQLAMSTGMFNLLWVAVVVLMIYRPGSTTGAGL
ncbi:DUF2269 family protein [Saccharopolyspora sp. NPDC002376]